MVALAFSFDASMDWIAGAVMVASGLVGRVRHRTRVVGVLLAAAGISWLLPALSFGPFSTLFIHRALLAAALAIAAEFRWKSVRTVAPLALFMLVSAIPDASTTRWVVGFTWGLVLVRTGWVAWRSPRRSRVAPALVAQGLMFTVAVGGTAFGILTADERRIIYAVAALAMAVFTARSATAPIWVDVVLDDRRDSAWSIALRQPGHSDFLRADGQPADLHAFARRAEFELADLGTGVLLHNDPAFDDPAVRAQLHSAVRLTCERIAVLLRIEAQRAEVDASRRRLLEADRLASSAVRRDLAQSVRPHLDAVDSVVSSAPNGANAARLVTEIRQEVEALASGVAPADLSSGLATGLRALAERSPLESFVDADECDLDYRTAIALFMVASEAAANAAKHSGGHRLHIELRDGSEVTLRVTDDGVGGAVLSGNGGLDHVHRRLEVLGGTLTVESRPGRGTTVTGRVPRPRL